MIKWSLRLAVISFAFFVCAVLGFSHLAIRATLSQVGQLAGAEQRFTLTAEDGTEIAASFVSAEQEDAPVILLLHGNGASRGQFGGHLNWLPANGFHALAIDFRGHGLSAEQSKSFGYNEAQDAHAAMRWARTEFPNSKVGVLGISLGGAAALVGKQGPLEADAMILQAVYPDFDRAVRNRVRLFGGDLAASALTPFLTYQAYPRYGVSHELISPVLRAREFERPILVIASRNDEYIPVSESEELAEAFPGRHWLWLVDGFSHGQISSLDDEVYRARVITFFREEL
ncbi:alpha/beta fold hydrolase [Erythrobacter sp. SCSIO 43205]|uniref:alpha/beta hydrolase n=1 Tax=Erythrobacter sp. SCSIO 43205 TaxID=2779361 RepID=UPI001CAA0397|nr:alpha/beta fold hydrolase [Erythrobacter sp. SCSIO 43205]UAB77763.1 alpha/beta fold hydrolase [Erythrobacter sp. SCSIO 43205]